MEKPQREWRLKVHGDILNNKGSPFLLFFGFNKGASKKEGQKGIRNPQNSGVQGLGLISSKHKYLAVLGFGCRVRRQSS